MKRLHLRLLNKARAKKVLRGIELNARPILVVVAVAVLGGYFLVASHAAGPTASIEAETGALAGGATIDSDANASGGHYVKFGNSAGGTASCPGLTSAAFCDNFNSPTTNSNGSRSGALNGTVWGVSRVTGNNLLPGSVNDWPWATLGGECGSSATVPPPQDIEVCNGQLHDSMNDGGTVGVIAMYPKQPFDFAGRTGKVVFDVNNDSQGNHAAWPEFWITDQPVPAPFTHEASWTAYPRNGLGIRFAGCTSNSGMATTCSQGNTDGSGGVGVDSAITISNYSGNDSFSGGNLLVDGLGSVKQAAAGQMNHYEIDVSQNQIDVYATDPFSGTLDLAKTPLVHIATIPNANLNFTRGLIWIEDAHYNADKFNTQRIHTFNWDNVGFDGPVLPRDLTFDAADNNVSDSSAIQAGALPGQDLGYFVGANSSTSLTISGVGGLSSASSAILLFNFIDNGPEPYTINYSVNGHAHSSPWPYPSGFPASGSSTNVSSPLTIALPLSLSDLVSGNNTVTFSAGGTGYGVYNVDILLPGAGGTPNPNTPVD